ncbi:hypothetical protein C8J57DRAFT_1633405 [Mycena rebaudengoi]|nr:hypothetical protein C8J57DRAFT_1633405 [Mycena rebaudengoi]
MQTSQSSAACVSTAKFGGEGFEVNGTPVIHSGLQHRSPPAAGFAGSAYTTAYSHVFVSLSDISTVSALDTALPHQGALPYAHIAMIGRAFFASLLIPRLDAAAAPCDRPPPLFCALRHLAIVPAIVPTNVDNYTFPASPPHTTPSHTARHPSRSEGDTPPQRAAASQALLHPFLYECDTSKPSARLSLPLPTRMRAVFHVRPRRDSSPAAGVLMRRECRGIETGRSTCLFLSL